MAKPSPQDQEERARIVAASALVALALMAFMLVIGAPREARAPRAQAQRPQVAATALHRANLVAFEAEPSACRAALRRARIEIVAAPDLSERGGACGYRDAVEMTHSLHAYSATVTASCAVAAGLVLWERDVVTAAARRYLHQAVTRIELAGPAYACRPIAGRSDGRVSEHAHANAIDIGGFTLEDGRVLSVAEGWGGSAEERAFMRAVRDGGCDLFQAVLSPDYNRAHHDHLHLDMGRDQMCR